LGGANTINRSTDQPIKQPDPKKTNGQPFGQPFGGCGGRI
jgi:hypothetical protein